MPLIQRGDTVVYCGLHRGVVLGYGPAFDVLLDRWLPGYIVRWDDGSVCPVSPRLVRRAIRVPSFN